MSAHRATRVVDADSHFIEPLDWIQQGDPDLAGQVPGGLTEKQFTEVIFGELLAGIPEEQRPTLRDALASGMRRKTGDASGEGNGQGGDGGAPKPIAELEAEMASGPMAKALRPQGAHDAIERLAFCDTQGIDVQLISPTLALGHLVLVGRDRPDLRKRLITAYNTWATQTVAGHTDRLIPVTMVDLDDVEWAVAELGRARQGGSRAFLFPLNPIDGRSLADPAYDPVWGAAVELGMVPLLHVGFGKVEVSPEWAAVGGKVVASSLVRMTMMQTPTVAQLALASLMYGGVFDRHPELVVVCEEFGVWWIEHWLDKVGPLARNGGRNSSAGLGWKLKLSADEYLQRNIRFSPLPGQRVDHLVEALGPDIFVFSTDYPHPEGSANARVLYEQQLAAPRFDDEVRAKFFGANMEQLLGAGASR